MQVGSGEPALRLDVFCPGCDGCGQAEHSQCTPDKHANSETEDWAVDLAVCPSCWGRGWWPVQGWPAVAAPDRVLTLRVPCGCTTDRAELVELELITDDTAEPGTNGGPR